MEHLALVDDAATWQIPCHHPGGGRTSYFRVERALPPRSNHLRDIAMSLRRAVRCVVAKSFRAIGPNGHRGDPWRPSGSEKPEIQPLCVISLPLGHVAH